MLDDLATREDAAHDRRNWVRLTYACNDRCVFCLDSNTHDGTMRDREEIKRQILDGRRVGATRLILSGGEPTIHPHFLDFVRLGTQAGYRKIQTVTNGRLFAYGDFLRRALDAGLSEITFSLHGPNARIHDALVGTKGAFEQEMTGLRAALADGRPIVNVDVVINRGNVQKLPEMLHMLYDLGVREFDLLQVVPFGRAFTEGRDTLFYDLVEAAPYLREALEFSRRPDVHVWFNRFPPEHLEGFEHLVQDPHKLEDETRGRKEELQRWLDTGEPMECNEPARCRYCYLDRYCRELERVRALFVSGEAEVVRFDLLAHAPTTFGGDPATRKRLRRLPLAADEAPQLDAATRGAKLLRVRARDLAEARPVIERSALPLDLELADFTGIEGVDRLVRARTADPVDAARLLSFGAHEVMVAINQKTADWLCSLDPVPARLALFQPTFERMSDAREHDVDLGAFFRRFTADVPVEGVTACLLGRPPRAEAPTVDVAMTEHGRLEVFRFASRYVQERFLTRSLRCGDCSEAPRCRGMHVNWVRAHGYAALTPIR